jgi:hypothetical protein
MAGRKGKTDAHDLLGTPDRAWLALTSLCASVAAGTLYAVGWRRLLLDFLGPAEMGSLLSACTALAAAGVGSALAWRHRRRGAVITSAARRVGRRGPVRTAAPPEETHRPPLRSFGLVNLGAAIFMLASLLARRGLLAGLREWPLGYLWPPELEIPYRLLAVLIAVAPPLVLVGFGAGTILYGWGRPPRARRQFNWYHGLELPATVAAGTGLGLAATALLGERYTAYADWVLLAALAGLVVSATDLMVGDRSALAEVSPSARSERDRVYRWRRFRVLALLLGLVAAVYLVSAEAAVRRAADGTQPRSLVWASMTALAALLAGMVLRRLLRGERHRARPEAGYALLVTGCAGLAGLSWLGWEGTRLLDGARPWAGTRAVAAAVAAVPFVGVGWVIAWTIGASPNAGVSHARTAAGMGPAAVGVALGALAAGLGPLPILGPAGGASLTMLAMVLVGAAVLGVPRGRGVTLRLTIAGAGVLFAATLLAGIRGGGTYAARSTDPPWFRVRAGLGGEVTAHLSATPRLNAQPLPGAEEAPAVARLRGAVPAHACRRLQRILVRTGGDPRLWLGLTDETAAHRSSPPDASRTPRLLVWDEAVPGTTRLLVSGAGTAEHALQDLFAGVGVHVRPAAPALPEHLAGAATLYDLILVDLRAADRLDLVRLASREAVAAALDRLTETGQAWYWLPLDRLSRAGLLALFATWLDVCPHAGVYLWEAEPGVALAALVAARQPLPAVRRGTSGRSGPSDTGPFSIHPLTYDLPAAEDGSAPHVLTLAHPSPDLLQSVDAATAREAAVRTAAENAAFLRGLCHPPDRR